MGLWLPVLLWVGLIYYLSSIPGFAIGEGAVDFWTRKPAHVAEYAILFLLLIRAMRGGLSWGRRKIIIGAGIFSLIYAVTDEFHQSLVPLREGRWCDLGFDLLGLAVGFFLLRFWWGSKWSGQN